MFFKIRNIFKIISIFKLYTGSIIILNTILKKIKINYCITTCCKKDLKNLINKLFIYDVGYPLIRIGSKKDGGYLVPKILNKIRYCFSPGVGQSFAFEKNLKKYKIHSFLADNTVQDPSSLNDKYDFVKKNLNSHNNNNNITLKNWIINKIKNKKEQNRLLLQMDIEGSEITIINHSNDNLLKKFSILIIEVHYLNALSTKSGLKLFDKFFSKILKNFYIYHMHANNCCGLNKIHEYDIPTVLEFGFINKELIKFKKLLKYKLPHKLDYKCVADKKDIKIPTFFYQTK
jgi:ribosomal protein S26